MEKSEGLFFSRGSGACGGGKVESVAGPGGRYSYKTVSARVLRRGGGWGLLCCSCPFIAAKFLLSTRGVVG